MRKDAYVHTLSVEIFAICQIFFVNIIAFYRVVSYSNLTCPPTQSKRM